MNWNLTKGRKEDEFGLDLFRKDISRVFDDFFSLKPTDLFESEWIPSIDVEDKKKSITLKAEIPGIDEKDLNVTIEKNILTISGEKKEERREEDKDKKYLFSERKFGSFSRSVVLPEGIKADNVKATFKKGVLNIEIPKENEAETKRIDIKVN